MRPSLSSLSAVTATLSRTTESRPRRARAYVPNGDVGRHIARAAELQAQIAELTALYDTERDWLRTHMQSHELATLELGAVRCVLKSRSRWTYSPETRRDMEQLAITQKWEQSQGVATNEPTFYVALTHSER